MNIRIEDWLGARSLMIEQQVDYVLSIGQFRLPDGFYTYPEQHRLRLNFADTSSPHFNNSPKLDDILKMVRWFTSLPPGGTLLIHCLAGESRSTAAAFILLASLYGPGHEQETLEKVIELRPIAWPNRLLVSLGDKVLLRDGALMRAYIEHETRHGWSNPRWHPTR